MIVNLAAGNVSILFGAKGPNLGLAPRAPRETTRSEKPCG